MYGHLKFTYEAPNQLVLNWTMWSQTKASIAKSSHGICLFWDYTAGEW